MEQFDNDMCNAVADILRDMKIKSAYIDTIEKRLQRSENIVKTHQHCEELFAMLNKAVEQANVDCKQRIYSITIQNENMVDRLKKKISLLESRVSMQDSLERQIATLNMEISKHLTREKGLLSTFDLMRRDAFLLDESVNLLNDRMNRVEFKHSRLIDHIDELSANVLTARSESRSKECIIEDLRTQLLEKQKRIEHFETHNAKFEEHYRKTKTLLTQRLSEKQSEIERLRGLLKLEKASVGNAAFSISYNKFGDQCIRNVRTVEPTALSRTVITPAQNQHFKDNRIEEKENLKRFHDDSSIDLEPNRKSALKSKGLDSTVDSSIARSIQKNSVDPQAQPSSNIKRLKELILQNAKVPPRMRCTYAHEEGGLVSYFDENTIKNADPVTLIEQLSKFEH